MNAIYFHANKPDILSLHRHTFAHNIISRPGLKRPLNQE